MPSSVVSSFVTVDVDRDGSVWEMFPGRDPAVVAGSVGEYLEGVGSGPEEIRARGTAANAPLLVAAYSRVLRQELGRIRVCSPRAGGTYRDPAAGLVVLARPIGPGSVGGWHDFGPSDYPSYALASIGPKGDGICRRHFLRAHPAWPALSFLDPRDEDAMAELLGLVIDPRFFVDPTRPEKTSRLESFLGLVRSRPGKFVALVSRCWWGGPGDLQARPGPGAFLWREANTPGPRRNPGRRFVEFLVANWLDAMAGKMCGDGLFAADHFFRDRDTARAFLEHVAIKRGRG